MFTTENVEKKFTQLKNCQGTKGLPIEGRSCAVVGNSNTILRRTDGAEIDRHDCVIRCNWATTAGFEEIVGSKITYRFLNTHSFWCTTSDWKGTKTLQERFGRFDRQFLFSLRDQYIVVKKPVPLSVFAEHFAKLRRQGNKVVQLAMTFHNICDSLVGGEATTGMVAILWALKHFETVKCFGFRFSEDGQYHHYFEEVKQYDQSYHKFDVERALMEWLDKRGYIELR